MTTAVQLRFELVVLDFDGTLADTRPAIAATLTDCLLTSRGVSPDPLVIAAAVGRGLPLDETLKLVATSAGHACDDLEVARLVDVYRSRYPQHASEVQHFDGFEVILRRLERAGTKVAVVSNKGEVAIHAFLESQGIASFVGYVFGDVPRRPRKPDPTLMLDHVLPRVGNISRNQVLVVGDTEVDLEFARNSGVASCWARFGYGDPAVCNAWCPDFAIDNPKELWAVLALAPDFDVD